MNSKISPPAGTISADKLCRITGRTDSFHRQLAKRGYFPLPVQGCYQADASITGFIRYQDDQVKKRSSAESRERIRLIRAKRLKLEKEFSVLGRVTVDLETVNGALRSVIHENNCKLTEIFRGYVVARFGETHGSAADVVLPIIEEAMELYATQFNKQLVSKTLQALGLDADQCASVCARKQ
jgi:hypothetical protein